MSFSAAGVRSALGVDLTNSWPVGCVTPPARPEIRRASCTRTAQLSAHPDCPARRTRSDCRCRDVVMPVVPMFHANAWGICLCGTGRRCKAGVTRVAARPRFAARVDGERTCDLLGRGPDGLAGAAGLSGPNSLRPTSHSSELLSAAAPFHTPDQRVRAGVRHRGRASVGYDGNLADRVGEPSLAATGCVACRAPNGTAAEAGAMPDRCGNENPTDGAGRPVPP